MNYSENLTPSWKSVMVTRHLPEQLTGLEMLCKNLWWCWNDDAKALFKSIDAELWHKSGHNPMEILDKVSLKRYNELAKDEDFLARMNRVINGSIPIWRKRTSARSLLWHISVWSMDWTPL